jgi:hypothetical protein
MYGAALLNDLAYTLDEQRAILTKSFSNPYGNQLPTASPHYNPDLRYRSAPTRSAIANVDKPGIEPTSYTVRKM